MQSKTTIVRQKKIEGISQAINNLVYFATHYQKSNLWLLKHSDMKKVLEITTMWKNGLIELEKIAQNSNTQAVDGDGTTTTKKGIDNENQ